MVCAFRASPHDASRFRPLHYRAVRPACYFVWPTSRNCVRTSLLETSYCAIREGRSLIPTTVSRRMLPALLILVTARYPTDDWGTLWGRPRVSRPPRKLVLFAADGLRQDLVAKYAKQGLLPTMGISSTTARWAADNGLLTQAAPNTGAGWYTLATGAWPGVHGSTNNTFHINGQPFGNSTSAFSANVPQAESIAQAAERARQAGRTGRVLRRRPDGDRGADRRLPALPLGARRGDELHRRRRIFADADHQLRASVRPPGWVRHHPAFAAAAPTSATGWTNVPTSYSPRAWRCGCASLTSAPTSMA